MSVDEGDAGSIPGLGRFPGKGNGNPLQYSWTSLLAQLVKNQLVVGDLGLIPGLGRFPGKGKGDPLQHSGLENPMDFTVGHDYRLYNPMDYRVGLN